MELISLGINRRLGWLERMQEGEKFEINKAIMHQTSMECGYFTDQNH